MGSARPFAAAGTRASSRRILDVRHNRGGNIDRRLGLGEVIGVRTWGGEIWLSSVNTLSDNGLARAPMMGVYGPEREWLIENHGVEPDLVVENLPHATFNGEDAQLDAAIAYLLNNIADDPRAVPQPPPFPDKSFRCPIDPTDDRQETADK